MPFIAECLFCKGKVRVPDSADGWSIECPRCGNSFTATPMCHPPKNLETPTPAEAPRPIVRPELLGTSATVPAQHLPPPDEMRSTVEEEGSISGSVPGLRHPVSHSS